MRVGAVIRPLTQVTNRLVGGRLSVLNSSAQISGNLLHARMHASNPVKATAPSAPIWIDCDAGADDALGILCTAKANIVAISTVRGNTAAEKAAKNVLRVLTLCSRQHVPVFIGADTSLNGDQQPLPKWSGKDGLNDQPDVFPSSASITAKPASGKASRKLVEAAQQHSGHLTVVATGPLTNLAHAVQADPQLVSNVHDLVVMGGNEAYNEWTSTGAEFNFYCDPDAADVVMQKFSGKLTLLTWECMQRNPLPGSLAAHIADKDALIAQFVAAVCGLSKDEKQADWVPCDPLAFAVATDNALVLAADIVQCRVEIQAAEQRGQTSFASGQSEGSYMTQGGTVRKVNQINTAKFAATVNDSTNSSLSSLQ